MILRFSSGSVLPDSLRRNNSDASFSNQLIGVLSVNIFVFIVAYIVFSAIKATIGLRLSKEGETKGTDVTETGVIAYAIRD